jgi:hypothetical protein
MWHTFLLMTIVYDAGLFVKCCIGIFSYLLASYICLMYD